MCFSATASFTVGATLAVAGVATLRRVQSWRELPLAAFPLLFATQQAIEGALWVQLNSSATGGPITSPFAQAFLFFAQFLWPVLVPIAAWLAEPLPMRRRLMAPFMPVGLAIGAYLLFAMMASPFDVRVHDHSIHYHSSFQHVSGIEYLYLAGISLPLILSSFPMIAVMGAANAVLLAGSKLLDSVTYVSVWCFLAAIASLCVTLNFCGGHRVSSRDVAR